MGRRNDHTRGELKKLILTATRDLVRENGITAISSRKIANRIGYTVGTVFQVFGNMDRLMAELNMTTLDALYEQCRDSANTGDTEQNIRSLATAFLDFASAHAHEWDAVISYQYTKDQTQTEEYQARVTKLHGAISDAISEFHGPGEEQRRRDDVSLLWTSLYGIFALDAANRLTTGYDTRQMLDVLIRMYVDARSA